MTPYVAGSINRTLTCMFKSKLIKRVFCDTIAGQTGGTNEHGKRHTYN